MSEVSRFFGKCGAGMASAANSMKRSAANTKQDGKIVDAEKTVRRMTREIGNLTVLMLDGNRTVGPDIMERYDAILAARKVIREAESEKVYDHVVCPKCGKRTSAGMRYCGVCGSLLAGEIQ